MGEPVISVKDLRLTPDGDAPLFSLDIARGRKVVVCGRSGCGKSTLLRALVGLAPQAGGTIAIDGRPLNAQTVWPTRAAVAFVVQEPDLGRGTVRDILERPYGFAANAHLQFDTDEAGALLERFDLSPDVMSQDIAQLSGGEKQRVALVSAILLKRRIYLLDEATSALDRDNARRVSAYFRALEDVTVLLATHEADDYSDWDRIVQLPTAAREAAT